MLEPAANSDKRIVLLPRRSGHAVYLFNIASKYLVLGTLVTSFLPSEFTLYRHLNRFYNPNSTILFTFSILSDDVLFTRQVIELAEL
jgi:hypothetical protein